MYDTGYKDDENDVYKDSYGTQITVVCPGCNYVHKRELLFDKKISFTDANSYNCKKCGEKIEFGLEGIIDP